MPRRRGWVNRTTQWVVGLGGGAVIAAIALIFLYLLWVVAPIFVPASIDRPAQLSLSEAPARLLDMSENGDVLVRVTGSGLVEFYDPATGDGLAGFSLGKPIRSAQRVYPTTDLYVLRDSQDQLWFAQTRYQVNFVDGERQLTPKLDFPFTTKPLDMGTFDLLDAQFVDDQLTLATVKANELTLTQYRQVELGFSLPRPRQVKVPLDRVPTHAYFGPRAQWLYLIDSQGAVDVIGTRSISAPQNLFVGQLVPEGTALTAVAPLLGRYSLVAANDQGHIDQWVMIRDEFGHSLQRVRGFDVGKPAQQIIVEPRRKGFATLDADGGLKLLYSTSRRIVAEQETTLALGSVAAIAPRSNYFVAEQSPGQISLFPVHNEHPDISWSTLWAKVWYEGCLLYTSPSPRDS